MSTYNFDKRIDRIGTNALATDILEKRFGRPDLLPLWVADMDFETPQFITDALRQRLDHSLFGYTVEPKDYRPAIIDWIESHHSWKVKSEWLTYIPGIVKGIGMAINVFVKADEKVIIQPPIYHPFRLTTLGNKREVVFNPLKETLDGSYEMDFEQLENVIDDKCRMLILSNPHNPGGVMWSAGTLKRLAAICHSHNIIVISDEIHCDLALWGNRHIPFATVSDEAAQCSITFGAPSKTFNIAGIVSSYAIVPNDGLRTKYYGWLEANELNEPPLFSPIATIAAFRQGEPWRKEMLKYVEENINITISYIKENIPAIRPWRPQASFLVWLDCRGMGLTHDELIDTFVNKARLALNDGEIFGKEGSGFMRLNVGCPRCKLAEALDRLSSILGNR